ncbi:hypothetical protein POPTR_019G002502v4 [Populus trichocarpa]|uniref:Uncharacterized protein n=1 Tax=Populus trichocarpa TaxID=3694 RepID=A0ACC0RHZ1_POPTR|nr:hypothetical protein BDE02_19G006200 [Populus trichocarpa]KAI9376933.1 hypothetical protein POPTR_019G002502v4 [Populus trichocarpa]
MHRFNPSNHLIIMTSLFTVGEQSCSDTGLRSDVLCTSSIPPPMKSFAHACSPVKTASPCCAISTCVPSLFCSCALGTSLLLEPATVLSFFSGGPSIAARAAS